MHIASIGIDKTTVHLVALDEHGSITKTPTTASESIIELSPNCLTFANRDVRFQ